MQTSLSLRPASSIAVLCALALLAPMRASADMGRIHVSSESVQVSEDAQKAIIVHNGEEEILILGTDLKATSKTGIIRFIPFPSEPSVSLAPGGAFKKVSAMIKKYGLVFQTFSISKGGQAASKEGIELRFNQKLGAHDLTLIKVNDVADFRQWVNDYFRKNGLPSKETYPEEEAVVADYVQRGIVWFVVDYVEIGPESRFIEPVSYRFKTRQLYYPLKTSNTFGGKGGIELIIITPTTLCRGAHTEGLEAGSQALYAKGPCLNLPTQASSSARIVREEEDLKALFPQGDAFFKESKAFIQFIRYYGKYHFAEDVFVDVAKGWPEEFSVIEEEENDVYSPLKLRLWIGCKYFTDSLEQKKCKLKPEKGLCKGDFTRFYFDLKASQCKPFSWGGCGGVVPFQSEDECRNFAFPNIPK